jgi:dTDP-4-amino-4,6-dideoxygalactose transaminase
VVTVSHTAAATASAILLAGARPVFVDVEADTLLMDTAKLTDAFTSRTRAVLPVHLYGAPVDMDSLLKAARPRNLRVIEDASQAHGALCRGKPVGGWGDVGCFSFYPTKNLGAYGDAGVLTTASAALAKKIRLLREYGWSRRYVSGSFGWNSRLDELQASFLRVKLPRLAKWNQARRKLAQTYREHLDGCSGVRLLREVPGGVHHLFVAMFERRDRLREALAKKGIQTLVHYPVPLHRQPAYRDFGRGPLPVTERACRSLLSLPLYPEMLPEAAEKVAGEIRSFYGD